VARVVGQAFKEGADSGGEADWAQRSIPQDIKGWVEEQVQRLLNAGHTLSGMEQDMEQDVMDGCVWKRQDIDAIRQQVARQREIVTEAANLILKAIKRR
jgi:hypothetical protein